MDGKSREETIAFVKPGNDDIALDVFDYLNCLLEKDNLWFEPACCILMLTRPPIGLIRAHHSALVGKVPDEVIAATIEAYRNGRTFFTYYHGENIVERVRQKTGDKDPVRAEDWTVRGKFRRDSLEVALREKRYLNNTLHSSANLVEAKKDSDLWLPPIIYKLTTK